jgi:lipopolysaccharide export system protein LptA
MKKIRLLLMLAAALAMPAWNAQAQEPEPEAATIAEDPMSSVFGSDFFKRVVAENIQYSSSEVKLTGAVEFSGGTLDLKCNTLTADSEKKILVARGTPVKIRQGDVRAECKTFTYNIETKSSRLEGNPEIYQTRGGKTTKTTGDIITINQNDKGEASVNISMNKNSRTRPEIVVIEDKTGEDKPKKSSKPAAKKVDDKSVDLIKLPSMD